MAGKALNQEARELGSKSSWVPWYLGDSEILLQTFLSLFLTMRRWERTPASQLALRILGICFFFFLSECLTHVPLVVTYTHTSASALVGFLRRQLP